ncbi:helix-turn-helix transcriptional regulator [Bacillus sp. S70]|uniref:helix-turn-helix domain-containing protein n=1 Tax=unclassified Bacillus (in: firmicutes) TaxID=185979 RepID=UPI00190A8E24|nr:MULTISPECIES: helix-turn-helix transcriptional regulator [unclassified Bacillus (in: firmicutes)]MBJ9983618.1 helix-turn-helix transcriptional regulator [Bacillus sp. S29]MBK0104721.1 helix-turn-helix transcriptional regulator [Bacillus sp. S70]MBK0110068.1 helix-turn-helix transcriptional regulator [Bacillus sp. S73]MBK0138848.1 helix-turn-helix transcriptional regulator [Bacillus sp. S72]MBK0148038.1 helix-turn-helix transcriptional regulator [Bacillus sp. S74]
MLPILSIRIKELRKERKWSQKELGEKVDVSESFISKVESGKKQPSREVTAKIAEIFNVTTDFLLGRSDEEDLNEMLDVKFKTMKERLSNLPESQREMIMKQAENLMAEFEKLNNHSGK